ncbi:aminodeoxychorismate synthase component I [Clostridium sp. SHJSY1]|uniref:aminodeoxychorismate synthase component I n=1 Tax=Clostridium sp. SHJSY1 TaxID=2942483 RepID=UPI002875A5DA|nr:aminodeoxychorismate synthase component I [Clostridium sp. SHJSY1]MDS0525739.1 aminodeoxychorismate synthase component I [Clostridium sp. SHJSY1]
MKIKELKGYYKPLDVYRLFADEKDSIFLDSSKEDSPYSLFSFIGVNPIWKFTSSGKNSYLDEIKLEGENPFKNLEDLLRKYKIEEKSNLPFIGGVIGYFSYDTGRILEEIPDISKEDFILPDSKFLLYENIIIFDIINKKMYLTALEIKGENSIYHVEETLKGYKEYEEVVLHKKNTKFYSNFEKEEYEKKIDRLKEYIRSGDTYIANMTRRIWCNNNESAFNIYEKLRSINKAPFSAFMNFEDFQVISSSPERFLSIMDRVVTTRPIKGTRPRGKDEEEDKINREALINSEKDKAELLMIVDLERNDLSKTCDKVKVTELFKIEKYATVFHLVATVQGILKNGVSEIQCLKECFPGGSITGAPKIRSMEIIEELEGLKRNLYTGSIGYFDLRGNCDFNIVIRTIIKKENKAYFGVGGGITWDSNPEEEWYETCDKAKALMKVL